VDPAFPTSTRQTSFETMLVREAMSVAVVTLSASDRPAEALTRLTSRGSAMPHQGFPVMDGERIVGVVTRWDLLEGSTAKAARVRDLVKRAPVVVSDSSLLRKRQDQLVRAGVGRLPVVSQDDPNKLVGILTRSDLLSGARATAGGHDAPGFDVANHAKARGLEPRFMRDPRFWEPSRSLRQGGARSSHADRSRFGAKSAEQERQIGIAATLPASLAQPVNMTHATRDGQSAPYSPD